MEYWRDTHQRFTKERFFVANAIALLTHTVTQPFDLAKTRAQILQEGKTFNGLGWRKGFHGMNILDQTMAAGGGFKKFYSSWDAFFLRTISYTTMRVASFCYFYDWINPDARRMARFDFYLYAGVLGGLVGGIMQNPFEIVFTRMQVDEMYPEQCRRNYKNFADGLMKVAEEGALFRGSIVNGMRFAGLMCAAGGMADLMKENAYFFFGPAAITRIAATATGVLTAFALSMPFDAIRTRLHTMRPLPNGQYPYRGGLDCFQKMTTYECNPTKHFGNWGAFYSGGQMYFLRLFAIALVSQYALDAYYEMNTQPELWVASTYKTAPGIDYDVHNPYTDAFNKLMVRQPIAGLGNSFNLPGD